MKMMEIILIMKKGKMAMIIVLMIIMIMMISIVSLGWNKIAFCIESWFLTRFAPKVHYDCDGDYDDDNKYNDDDGTDLTLVQGTSWSHKAGDRIVFLSAQAEMLVDDYDSRDVWDDDVIVFFLLQIKTLDQFIWTNKGVGTSPCWIIRKFFAPNRFSFGHLEIIYVTSWTWQLAQTPSQDNRRHHICQKNYATTILGPKNLRKKA